MRENVFAKVDRKILKLFRHARRLGEDMLTTGDNWSDAGSRRKLEIGLA